MAMEVIFYSVLGYFLGSLMFGYLIPRIFKGIDVRSLSSDGNPGTANAFFMEALPAEALYWSVTF